MNLIEYQLDKMYKTISFGNDCAKKIAIKNWIKTNLIKCKGFKNKNRPFLYVYTINVTKS